MARLFFAVVGVALGVGSYAFALEARYCMEAKIWWAGPVFALNILISVLGTVLFLKVCRDAISDSAFLENSPSTRIRKEWKWKPPLIELISPGDEDYWLFPAAITCVAVWVGHNACEILAQGNGAINTGVVCYMVVGTIIFIRYFCPRIEGVPWSEKSNTKPDVTDQCDLEALMGLS